MFGYVVPAKNALNKEEEALYKAHYCGLCHSLKKRYGSLERFSLSYDLTFLSLLLTSLYEPDSRTRAGRCLPHPLQTHSYLEGDIQDYCADMNLLLAWYKVQDNIEDDKSLLGKAEAALLGHSVLRLKAGYPSHSKRLHNTMEAFREEEHSQAPSLDRLLNLSAQLLGTVYEFRDDYWTPVVRAVGEGLGRFVYLMDAWDDLPDDRDKKRFNPLLSMTEDPDLPAFVENTLTNLLGEAAEAFEILPLVNGTSILRNILYSGCWTRFSVLKAKRGDFPAAKGVHA